MAVKMTGGSREEPLLWRRHAARRSPRRRGLSAPYALPAGFAALFAVGTVAAALNGRLSGTGVLIICAVVVTVISALSEATAAVPDSRPFSAAATVPTANSAANPAGSAYGADSPRRRGLRRAA